MRLEKRIEQLDVYVGLTRGKLDGWNACHLYTGASGAAAAMMTSIHPGR